MDLCLTLLLFPSRGNLNALCKSIIKPVWSYTFWECPFFLDWILYKLHVYAWVQSSLQSCLTNTIALLFFWPSADIIPEQNRAPNLSSGLCWALPDSVPMLGKKWPLGLIHTVKRRGIAPRPGLHRYCSIRYHTRFGYRWWWDETWPLKDSRWSTFLNGQEIGLPVHRRDTGS